MAKVVIVDYGVGNLRSVEKAFAASGHTARVTNDREEIERAERVVLPGVGAFGAAINTLRASGLEACVLDAARGGRPFLGICVGMQLLFTQSEEMGTHNGLNLIPGRVKHFNAKNLGPDADGVKVPQIGWNALNFPKGPNGGEHSPLFAGLPNGAMAYFLHSFYCAPDEENAAIARTDFIAPYCSAVAKNNVMGVQFHPEKSGAVGLQILDNWARWSG